MWSIADAGVALGSDNEAMKHSMKMMCGAHGTGG